MDRGLKAMRAIVVCLPVLLACGCSSTESGETPEASAEKPIAFYDVDVKESRAPSLSLISDNFLVKAVKTMPDNSTQLVIPGYKVVYNNGLWGYAGQEDQYMKYWDILADSYLFAAVSPAPNNSPEATVGFRDTTVDIDLDGNVTIGNIKGNTSTGNYTNSSRGPEWMVARTIRTRNALSDVDDIEPTVDLHDAEHPLNAFTDIVPLNFHHIMAKVDFRVWSTSQIILQSFKVDVADGQELLTRADYSTTDGWTNVRSEAADNPLVYCEYTYLDGKTVTTDSDSPVLLSSHVQIPQDWIDAGARKFKISFVTKDDKKYSGDIILNTTTNGGHNSWDPDKHYIYTIKINAEGGNDEVILFAVEMNAWKWKPGSSHQDFQTDW